MHHTSKTTSGFIRVKAAFFPILLAPFLFIAALPAADPPTSSSSTKLDDLRWLVGKWQCLTGERVVAEEHWSAAGGGAMMGMSRLMNGDKPSVYELLLIEAEADGVWMRLRHFRSQMVPQEQEPIKLKLTSSANEKLVFENPDSVRPKRIIYTLVGNDLIVTVETERDDKTAGFSLTFRRVK